MKVDIMLAIIAVEDKSLRGTLIQQNLVNNLISD
jgi:hypothetical protein